MIVDDLKKYNEEYRRGAPLISDAEYDALTKELAAQDPYNEFFRKPEPEPLGEDTLVLPKPMLSTQKAYTYEELFKWFNQVDGLPEQVMVTPKIDGFSAYYFQGQLASRGDGEKGTNYSHAIARLKFEEWVEGPGEIAINKVYFEKHLSSEFKNTRNVIAAVLKKGPLEPLILAAVRAEAFRFVPFSWLKYHHGVVTDLNEDFTTAHFVYVKESFPLETDGLVIEFQEDSVKNKLGSTDHHHRWQIAFKQNTEVVQATVIGVRPQTGRTGKVTPVLDIEPIEVGGVTVSRATAHNYMGIIANGIGEGAVIELMRAGQVIPYVRSVLTPSVATWPKKCPSCGYALNWEGNDLVCNNKSDCPAQLEGAIVHFFKTIGDCDGFGPGVARRLADYSQKHNLFDVLEALMGDEIYKAVTSGVAANLKLQFRTRRETPLSPAKLLAALGIRHVGEGTAKRILDVYKLEELHSVPYEGFLAIKDVGETTATSLWGWLNYHADDLSLVADWFNVQKKAAPVEGVLLGQSFCVTGVMPSGRKRDVLHKLIMENGGIVHQSVQANTTYLVAGNKVGINKTSIAEKRGVKVITEKDFDTLLSGEQK